MQIKLSDHFSYGRLLRFTLPSIIMMVISSIYSVVDGLFVSNLVGDLAQSSRARWARATSRSPTGISP